MGRGFGFSTLGTPGASVAEVVATARRHGCRGAELRAAPDEFLHVGMPADAAAEVREVLAEAGVVPLAVSTYVRLCAPDAETAEGAPGDGDAQLADLLAHVDLARRIGATAVRVFMRDPTADETAPDPDALTEGERRGIRRIRAVAEACADAGVAVLVETHDSHSTGARMARFLARLDAEVPGHGAGVVWDTAHSWTHGEPPAQTLAVLRPWLCYLQVKDVRTADDPVPVPLGAGGFPVAELAAALRAADWTGWISLEWERRWHPELPPLDEALAALPAWAAPLLDRTAFAPTGGDATSPAAAGGETSAP